MVEAVADMPTGTMGFRIYGGLTGEDYVRTLVPPLREAVERGERLRVLYKIDHGLSMTPGAMWEDFKLQPEMGIKHRDAWDRIAVVTDIDWLWRSFELFSWMVPGDMRLFHDSELEIAKQWVAGSGE